MKQLLITIIGIVLLIVVLNGQSYIFPSTILTGLPSHANDFGQAFGGTVNDINYWRLGIAPNFPGVCLGVAKYNQNILTPSACRIEFYWDQYNTINLIGGSNDYPAIVINQRPQYNRIINPGGQPQGSPHRIGIGGMSGYPQSYLNATLHLAGDFYSSGTFGEINGTTFGWHSSWTFMDQDINSNTIARGIWLEPIINYTGNSRTGQFRGISIDLTEISIPTGGIYPIHITKNGNLIFSIDDNGNIFTVGTITHQ